MHRPVASAGFGPAGVAAAVVELDAAVDAAACFFFEDDDAVVSLPVVDVEDAASAAYHSLTPLCPWHAPFFAAAEVKLPSLH